MSHLTLNPIGTIHTGVTVKFNTRHQPNAGRIARNVVELLPHQGFEVALRDLDGFSHIWLIWWFDRNTNWRPTALPPRGSTQRRGVFATRSPHRPNPIGISAVPLLGIEGLKVFVGDVDLLDGTPILDIKPYLTTADTFPEASLGWVGEVEDLHSAPPRYAVTITDLARAQIEWLKSTWSIEFIERAVELLALDPSVHRTRRIRKLRDGRFIMGCGTWRIIFSVCNFEVTIDLVTSGYPEHLVMGERSHFVQEQSAHIDFLKRWRRSSE